MKIIKNNYNFNFLFILGLFFLLCSCGTVKDSLFLNSKKIKEPPILPEKKIGSDSILYTLQIINPGDLLSFRNLQNETQVLGYTSGAGGTNISNNYPIEVDSTVDLPALGKVKLGGLEISQAEKLLNIAYSKNLLKDPMIKISVNNLKVTLLGEFAKQGNFPLKKNYVHLTEILGESGGLTVKADAKKVQIIRGDLKKPEVILVNLKDLKSLADDRLYLRNNDILYVDVKKSARFIDQITSVRTIIGIAVSAFTAYLLIARLR